MDEIKEEIKYETELLKLIWLTAVAVIGGSLGLLLAELSVLRAGLAGSGLTITVVLIVIAGRQDRQIRKLLQQMKKEQTS